MLERYALQGTGLENLGTRSPNLTGASSPEECIPIVGQRNGSSSCYPISARPLPVSRTSSPMTVMFSSRPTIRLMLHGIAPPVR